MLISNRERSSDVKEENISITEEKLSLIFQSLSKSVSEELPVMMQEILGFAAPPAKTKKMAGEPGVKPKREDNLAYNTRFKGKRGVAAK